MYTKQQIIDEIKRTAEENGGQVLGQKAFKGTTGIQDHHWRGKYWLRWSQAQQEAGFDKTKWNSKTDRQRMLASLASLTEKLGHFPTESELIQERHQDHQFPSKSTFRRLGSQWERAKALLEYCQGYHLPRVVLVACQAKLAERAGSGGRANPSSALCTGYVYLLKMGGKYKIGKSDDPERRAAQVGLLLPDESKIIHKILTDDPFGVEAYWHRRFGGKNIRGEFFKLDHADIQAFKRWKKIW